MKQQKEVSSSERAYLGDMLERHGLKETLQAVLDAVEINAEIAKESA